jgi:hypothetical protein
MINKFVPKVSKLTHEEKMQVKLSKVAPKPKRASKVAGNAVKRAPKKNELKKLKAEVWELCKQITRKTYVKPDGTFNCYTCGRLIDIPAKAHTGHFRPSSTCGALLRHDIRNLRIQDYYCNINLGGHGSEYYVRMVAEKGQEHVDQILADETKTIKADVHFYQGLKDKYTELLKTL